MSSAGSELREGLCRYIGETANDIRLAVAETHLTEVDVLRWIVQLEELAQAIATAPLDGHAATPVAEAVLALMDHLPKAGKLSHLRARIALVGARVVQLDQSPQSS